MENECSNRQSKQIKENDKDKGQDKDQEKQKKRNRKEDKHTSKCNKDKDQDKEKHIEDEKWPGFDNPDTPGYELEKDWKAHIVIVSFPADK